MILKLRESKLFTEDPALRFADAYHVTENIYRELWRRHRDLEYSISELCEFFYIRVGMPIKKKKMDEWMFMGRVYMKVERIMEKGALSVDSSFFGELEERLLNKLSRHMRQGVTFSMRTLA